MSIQSIFRIEVLTLQWMAVCLTARSPTKGRGRKRTDAADATLPLAVWAAEADAGTLGAFWDASFVDIRVLATSPRGVHSSGPPLQVQGYSDNSFCDA